jgi:hypothetical protein
MIDIKIPIGLMFLVFGILLTAYGFITISDVEMYKKTFSINMNLWSGVGMLIFGSLMLFLSRKKSS